MVVLPTPPFWLATARIAGERPARRAGVASSAGSAPALHGGGRPSVRPSGLLGARRSVPPRHLRLEVGEVGRAPAGALARVGSAGAGRSGGGGSREGLQLVVGERRRRHRRSGSRRSSSGGSGACRSSLPQAAGRWPGPRLARSSGGSLTGASCPLRGPGARTLECSTWNSRSEVHTGGPPTCSTWNRWWPSEQGPLGRERRHAEGSGPGKDEPGEGPGPGRRRALGATATGSSPSSSQARRRASDRAARLGRLAHHQQPPDPQQRRGALRGGGRGPEAAGHHGVEAVPRSAPSADHLRPALHHLGVAGPAHRTAASRNRQRLAEASTRTRREVGRARRRGSSPGPHRRCPGRPIVPVTCGQRVEEALRVVDVTLDGTRAEEAQRRGPARAARAAAGGASSAAGHPCRRPAIRRRGGSRPGGGRPRPRTPCARRRSR